MQNIPYTTPAEQLRFVSGLEEAGRLVAQVGITDSEFLRRAARWMEGNRNYEDPFWRGVVTGYRLIADDIDDVMLEFGRPQVVIVDITEIRLNDIEEAL